MEKDLLLINELIKLYESIIHGDDNNLGLFQCYDTYYKGFWDDKLEEIEIIKNKLIKLNS